MATIETAVGNDIVKMSDSVIEQFFCADQHAVAIRLQLGVAAVQYELILQGGTTTPNASNNPDKTKEQAVRVLADRLLSALVKMPEESALLVLAGDEAARTDPTRGGTVPLSRQEIVEVLDTLSQAGRKYDLSIDRFNRGRTAAQQRWLRCAGKLVHPSASPIQTSSRGGLAAASGLLRTAVNMSSRSMSRDMSSRASSSREDNEESSTDAESNATSTSKRAGGSNDGSFKKNVTLNASDQSPLFVSILRGGCSLVNTGSASRRNSGSVRSSRRSSGSIREDEEELAAIQYTHRRISPDPLPAVGSVLAVDAASTSPLSPSPAKRRSQAKEKRRGSVGTPLPVIRGSYGDSDDGTPNSTPERMRKEWTQHDDRDSGSESPHRVDSPQRSGSPALEEPGGNPVLPQLTPFGEVQLGPRGLKRALVHLREQLSIQSADVLSRLAKSIDVAVGHGDNAHGLLVVGGSASGSNVTVSAMLSHGLADLGLLQAKAILVDPEKVEMLHDTLGLLDMDGEMSLGLLDLDGEMSVPGRMSGSFKSALPAAAAAAAKGSETWKYLAKAFQNAPPKSLTMVLVRDIASAAVFMKEEEELVKSKLAQVTIVGNVLPSADANGELLPDPKSWYTTAELQAAKWIFQRCQKPRALGGLGLPLVIVTNSAVTAAAMPPFLFDELAVTAHPVALRLREASLQSMNTLWTCANEPAGSDARQGLPDECDVSWFAETFCGGRSLNAVDAKATIWPYTTSVPMDETLAILASHPKTLEKFFEVSVQSGRHGIEHIVINGFDGIRDMQQLRSFTLDLFSHVLTSSSWCTKRRAKEDARAQRRKRVPSVRGWMRSSSSRSSGHSAPDPSEQQDPQSTSSKVGVCDA